MKSYSTVAAPQVAFNNLVTVGTKNDQQIMNNVASVQNFVGSLGGDSKVWNQIQSIDKATVTGNGLQSTINFTVNDHKAFIGALKETKDSAGSKRFLDMTDYVGKYDMGHPVSLRELGYGVTDPSMHVESGSTSSKGFGAHWDPSSSLTHQTGKEALLDAFAVSRRVFAGIYHWSGKASTGAVRQSLKDQGLVPQH